MGHDRAEAWLDGAGSEGWAAQGSFGPWAQGGAGGYFPSDSGIRRLGPRGRILFRGNDGETRFHCVQFIERLKKPYVQAVNPGRLDTFRPIANKSLFN